MKRLPSSDCILAILVVLIVCRCGGPSISADELHLDKNIELVATSERQWTGVALSDDKRLFMNYPNWSETHTYSVAELREGSVVRPFPDESWNTWDPEADPERHFICVQSVFIDKNNFLWVVDAANPQRDGEYQGVVNGGAKLLKFNPVSGELAQSILFQAPVIKPNSYLNDVRIDEENHIAYLTDSNEGALLIVDLVTGITRRILDSHPSTDSEGKVLTVEGATYRSEKGMVPQIHADGIALSNDRSYLYWRALTAEGLYRIATSYLTDASLSDEQLTSHVEKLGNFPPSDGMAFGYYGELYLTSIEENAIRAYNHGNETRLIRQREDIKWPDSFAVGQDGYLYFTTSQLHLSHPEEPYKLFKIRIRF